jgi:hypothetical protein
MAYNAAIALDLVSQSQSGHDSTINNALKALSPAALFGIKQSATSGLTFTLYGGNFPISGTPTALADQAVTLTASTTNYIYATSAGVVTKTTSAPSGWPGPLLSGAIALYQLTVGTASITSGTNYRVGLGTMGATGAVGATGAPGSDFAGTRKRIFMTIGSGSTNNSVVGFATVSASITARSLASSSLRESIPYGAYVTAGSAGSSIQPQSAVTTWYLGNAAGRGGFTVSFRFCFESAVSPANQRSFIGLINSTSAIGNVEPDTLINLIGVGAKAGVANLSLIHNDGSGTATVTLLNSNGSPTQNFPARATDNVYELTLSSVANSGTVTYSLTTIDTGDVATGSVSSDLPSNTTFLQWVGWVNNGSTASSAALGIMQIIGESRY